MQEEKVQLKNIIQKLQTYLKAQADEENSKEGYKQHKDKENHLQTYEEPERILPNPKNTPKDTPDKLEKNSEMV